MTYLPELDRLRFFAAFAVFCHHVYSPFTAGKFGVDLFFCLSAFLITRLLVAEKEKYGKVDAKRFYFRRMFRIFPLYYFFVLFIAIPFSHYTNLEIFGFLFVFINIVFAFNGYPGSVGDHLWSISIEEHFYFTFPFFYRWIGNLPVIAFTMLAISIVSRLFIDNPWTFTLTRLDPIALGILLIYVKPPQRFRLLYIAVGIAGFLAADRLNPGLGYPLAAISAATVVVSNIGMKAENKFLIYLGRISYGLYVWHLLALRISERVVLLLSAFRLAIPWFQSTYRFRVDRTLCISLLQVS
jgi:peptidoglycan/LPS O-acetylase OafA/YrhL